MLLSETLTAGVSWSPYYKVTTHPSRSGPGALSIWVNGVPHQTMARADWRLANAAEQYGTPYERLPGGEASTTCWSSAQAPGSDVAIALRKGAKHVDAVEIDPRILQLGRQHNPDHAYQDQRVTTHVNDGRAFLENTDTKYDLILFALPDSLALVNGASQIRLESFLFTEEALRSAHDHLKPDGGFAMYNFYRENWLIDRLAGTAAAAFGHTPCVDSFTAHQAVVTVAVQAEQPEVRQRLPAEHDAGGGACDRQRTVPLLPRGGIPQIYVWALVGILLLSVLLVRAVGGPFREMRPYADLFFMGVAFLLLETKNVATFALLFGTTWMVNAMVFTGVLSSSSTAVETTRRFRTPLTPGRLRRRAGLARAGVGGQARVPARAAVRSTAARSRRSSPSCRSSWPTWRSPSASRRPPTPRRPSGSTSSARSSAAAWSTPPCSPATTTSSS